MEITPIQGHFTTNPQGGFSDWEYIMMKIAEKIRFLRQQQGKSQEDMANELKMSVNGYAKIERGKTDIQLSRLEEIAEILKVDLLELLNFGEKNVFYLTTGENSHQNYQCYSTVHNYTSAIENQKLQEENTLLREQIEQLKEIIALMKKS